MAFDWLELVLTAHREFGSRLAAVEDWNAPTPDSDWHVEHLVRGGVDVTFAVSHGATMNGSA